MCRAKTVWAPRKPRGTEIEARVRITVDRFGWPVEGIIGQPVRNFLRRLIHGRSRRWIVMRGTLEA